MLPPRAVLRFEVRSRGWEHLLHRQLLKAGDHLTKFQREARRLLPWPRCLARWVRKIPRGGAPSFLLLFCPFLFRVLWCKTSRVLLRYRRTREGVASEPKGRRTRCLPIWSLPSGSCRPFYGDSDLMRVDAMSIEDVLALSLQGSATVCPGTFICLPYL